MLSYLSKPQNTTTMPIFKNLVKWLFMTVLTSISFWLFDLLLMFSLIVLVKLPTWMWIVFGGGILWFFMFFGVTLCGAVVKWLIHRGPSSKISPNTVKALAVLNAILVIAYWWFGNDKFSFESVVWRIVLSAIAVLLTYMSIMVCKDESTALTSKLS
jgi:CDP-diglyceride synthetase